jgi:rare lipoprotein A
MYDLTAAHPTLPLGSWVRVTNLRNGRAVVVRINDRGPVVPGRIIDLSYNTARVLRFSSQGLQRVRLDVIHNLKAIQQPQQMMASLQY